MRRLLDLPGDDQRVDDGVDAEMPLTPVAPGGPVVRGHRESQQPGDRVDGALHFFLLAALAEALDRHIGCLASRGRAQQHEYQSRTIGTPMKLAHRCGTAT